MNHRAKQQHEQRQDNNAAVAKLMDDVHYNALSLIEISLWKV
jgi:hypothetical protein